MNTCQSRANNKRFLLLWLCVWCARDLCCDISGLADACFRSSDVIAQYCCFFAPFVQIVGMHLLGGLIRCEMEEHYQLPRRARACVCETNTQKCVVSPTIREAHDLNRSGQMVRQRWRGRVVKALDDGEVIVRILVRIENFFSLSI